MLEVKIPSEIRDYKGKLMFGLTVRHIIAIASMFVVGVVIGVYVGRFIALDYLIWLIILAVAPIGLWGFVPFKGMKFEEYTKVLFKFYFTPQKRIYEDVEVNYLAEIQTKLSANIILKQRIERGDIDFDEDDFEEDDNNVW